MVKAETIRELGELLEKNMILDEFKDKIFKTSDEEEKLMETRDKAVLVSKMFEFLTNVASVKLGKETDLEFLELMEVHIEIAKKIATIDSITDMSEEERKNVANWIVEKKNFARKLEEEFVFGK